nr:hypothetical protein [uncultured Flavobacterium sp.]
MQSRVLTISEIKFIDTYLSNSGVEYLDIRYEMTDHVAKAIENMDGDFMEDFKSYMIKNKQQLLSDNRKFKRLAAVHAVKELGKTLCGFWVIPAMFIVVFATHYFFAGIAISDAVCYLRLMFLAPYLVGLAKVSGTGKFSVSSTLYGVCGVIFYYGSIIAMPERLIQNLWVVYTLYSAVIILGIALSITAYRVHRKFKFLYSQHVTV